MSSAILISIFICKLRCWLRLIRSICHKKWCSVFAVRIIYVPVMWYCAKVVAYIHSIKKILNYIFAVRVSRTTPVIRSIIFCYLHVSVLPIPIIFFLFKLIFILTELKQFWLRIPLNVITGSSRRSALPLIPDWCDRFLPSWTIHFLRAFGHVSSDHLLLLFVNHSF